MVLRHRVAFLKVLNWSDFLILPLPDFAKGCRLFNSLWGFESHCVTWTVMRTWQIKILCTTCAGVRFPFLDFYFPWLALSFTVYCVYAHLRQLIAISRHFWSVLKRSRHTPDTLGTLSDIAANARPLRAWLKCRTITTHARESVADLSRNCKGFRARESVHARVTESRAQGTGVGRDIR